MMKIDQILLAVIAVSTSTIAFKMVTTPEPTTHAAFMALNEKEKRGEDVSLKRAELLQHVPWVHVRNTVSVNLE